MRSKQSCLPTENCSTFNLARNSIPSIRFVQYKKLTFKTKTEPTGLSSFLLSHTTPVLSSHLSNKTVGRLKQTIGDNKSYCSLPAVTQEEHEKTNNEM